MQGDDKKSGQKQGEQSGWEYKVSGKAAASGGPPPMSGDGVEWTASEFIAHQKGAAWFVGLGVLGLLLAAGVYVITHDVFSVIMIGTLAAVIGVAAGRQPRVMEYRLDRSGLVVGKKFHPYGEFKAFSLVDEGAFTSISFMSLKRFMPPVSIYFSPEDEQKIINVLSQHLPMQPADGGGFDAVLRRIRF